MLAASAHTAWPRACPVGQVDGRTELGQPNTENPGSGNYSLPCAMTRFRHAVAGGPLSYNAAHLGLGTGLCGK
ncbi:uncharacterized protein UV8b_07226 [Ustilaginoidea virens]|uniref:Uncharacterized protein n=1 Tax=Ustilaginoidea virens TaxID=1159556 RepID=A0A8E5HWN4_USTVR|nr:uncharacterized protein UV8b_07226 [Ustilaginoidea virens]QUC22985.1 hypothetical protein UV8b_07226 [Ustilaginoidea virens]